MSYTYSAADLIAVSDEPLLTTRQLKAKLNVSDVTIRNWMRDIPDFPVLRLSEKVFRFDAKAVVEAVTKYDAERRALKERFAS